MPLENVVNDIMEAQLYLTAIVAAPDPIDLRLVCRTLQHLSGDPTVWSPSVLRLAKRFAVKLIVWSRKCPPRAYARLRHQWRRAAQMDGASGS